MTIPIRAAADLQESEIPWCPQRPSHWFTVRTKWLFQHKKVLNQIGEQAQILSLTLRGVVENDPENPEGLVPKDYNTYQVFNKGDLVFKLIDLENLKTSRVGLVHRDGIMSPAYVRLVPTNPMVVEYFYYQFYSLYLQGVYNQLGSGVRSTLGPSDLGNLPIFLPPLEEQQKIVSFIQQQDRRIRKFIRNKKKLIGMLRDRRKQICNSIIGRGLNAEAPMKTTAFPWVGEIPVHWKLTRIKNEFICLNPRRIPLSSSVRGGMSIRRYDYYGASGVIDKVDGYIFDDDLLLIAEDGANLVFRNLPLAIIARGKFWVNNHAHILKPREGDLEFLAMALERLNYSPWITGAAQPKLTKDRLMSIPIAVPSPDEQRIIVEALRRELSPLDASINQARVEIDLIGEYRSRLIADAVTGKIDLRNFQPSDEAISPDTDPDLSIEESDELNEDYNEDEELLAEAVNAN